MLLRNLAAIAMAAFVPGSLGNEKLETTSYEVRSSRIPESFIGFCIVQISDLHNQSFAPGQSDLLERVRAAHPDLIAITGDLSYHGKWSTNATQDLARNLASLAPVYFITGNHDITSSNLDIMLSVLQKAGVEVLRGRNAIVRKGEESITVSGIDDPMIFQKKKDSPAGAMKQWKASLTTLRMATPPGSYTLLLSHRPELIDSYADLGFDLVLTGHAHGGQIRLPLIGGVYAPDQGFFPRYTSGNYSRGGMQMIVSRGLGRSYFPFRIFNRPELVIVRLSR